MISWKKSKIFLNDELFMRIGFTASSKLGNAVKRNKIKRKLRALAREVIYQNACYGYDYVLIGRMKTFDRNFLSLIKDLKYALHTTRTYKNSKQNIIK